LCGSAATFECSPNDNLGVHAALYRADPGSVLVGGGGSTERFGLFGELMATDAVARGLGGLVVDGTVRDLADPDRIGFPVVCAGAAPAQCTKSPMVSVGRPVTIGGVLVRPGDHIVADRDGVVVVPSLIWKEVKEAALATAVREDGYLRRLRLGERIVDVLGLDIGDSRS
jgi:4-hydroxy-4-methyl-2-oxoglutarate aldolase